MTRILTVVLGIVLLLTLLLGVGYCREREARQRAEHDPKADSLRRDTEEATVRLVETDTALKIIERHYIGARARVDTVRLPAEVRAVVRACDEFVVTCRMRAERADSLVAALRRELEHAQEDVPQPRRSFFIRSDYDFLNKELAAQAGVAYRLFGRLEAYGGVAAGQHLDSLRTRRTEPKLILGGQLTFR